LLTFVVGLACTSWPVGDQPYQADQRLNSPGTVIGTVEGVALGDRVALPYTMTPLRRNLPGPARLELRRRGSGESGREVWAARARCQARVSL